MDNNIFFLLWLTLAYWLPLLPCVQSTHNQQGNNMQTSIIQPAPRMRSLLPYALVFLACCAAIVLPTVLAMREADGSFEPANLTVRLDAMPRWLHDRLIVVRSI